MRIVLNSYSFLCRYAIQLAKLAGLKIATTASPAKHELVKSLGADVVVDYKVRSRSIPVLAPSIADEHI